MKGKATLTEIKEKMTIIELMTLNSLIDYEEDQQQLEYNRQYESMRKGGKI